jgi:hypothetical protein
MSVAQKIHIAIPLFQRALNHPYGGSISREKRDIRRKVDGWWLISNRVHTPGEIFFARQSAASHQADHVLAFSSDYFLSRVPINPSVQKYYESASFSDLPTP